MLTGKIMNIMVKWMPLKIPVLQKTHITKIINNKYNSKKLLAYLANQNNCNILSQLTVKLILAFCLLMDL